MLRDAATALVAARRYRLSGRARSRPCLSSEPCRNDAAARATAGDRDCLLGQQQAHGGVALLSPHLFRAAGLRPRGGLQSLRELGAVVTVAAAVALVVLGLGAFARAVQGEGPQVLDRELCRLPSSTSGDYVCGDVRSHHDKAGKRLGERCRGVSHYRVVELAEEFLASKHPWLKDDTSGRDQAANHQSYDRDARTTRAASKASTLTAHSRAKAMSIQKQNGRDRRPPTARPRARVDLRLLGDLWQI